VGSAVRIATAGSGDRSTTVIVVRTAMAATAGRTAATAPSVGRIVKAAGRSVTPTAVHAALLLESVATEATPSPDNATGVIRSGRAVNRRADRAVNVMTSSGPAMAGRRAVTAAPETNGGTAPRRRSAPPSCAR